MLFSNFIFLLKLHQATLQLIHTLSASCVQDTRSYFFLHVMRQYRRMIINLSVLCDKTPEKRSVLMWQDATKKKLSTSCYANVIWHESLCQYNVSWHLENVSVIGHDNSVPMWCDTSLPQYEVIMKNDNSNATIYVTWPNSIPK